MCFKRKVFCHAKSIYEIESSFYESLGVKFVLTDLDNTLDSYKLYQPSEKAVKLKKDLDEKGIKLFIISNNKGHRVGSYANALGVEYLSSSGKPFGKKLKRFIKDKNINPEQSVFIGDQMLTDIGAANKANIKAILTDKIVKEDQWTTHFNRLIDRPLKKRYMRKGKLVDWRKVYGKS